MVRHFSTPMTLVMSAVTRPAPSMTLVVISGVVASLNEATVADGAVVDSEIGPLVVTALPRESYKVSVIRRPVPAGLPQRSSGHPTGPRRR